MRKADNFDAKQWLVENKITFQSRLNENEEFSDDFPSLDYNTITNFIKSKGYKITSDYYDGGFDVNDGEYFVGIFNDHIAVTDNNGQVKDIPFNESRLNENEDLAAKISALPDFETSPDTEEATLVVGNYAVVHYDQTDEGGEDMYVVWDNTRDQEEIGSYDDEPEFESADPAEVAAFLKKNESLNEDESFQKPSEDSDIESLKKRYRYLKNPEDLETIASKQNPKLFTIGSPEFDANAIQLGDYIKFSVDNEPTLVFQSNEKSVNAAHDNAEYSQFNRSLLSKLNREELAKK